jgi:hypothetical protein
VKNKRDRTNKVLPFPIANRPPENQDALPSTVFFQIGSDRFAMHMWYESLPPAPLLRMAQVASSDTAPKPVSQTRERRGPAARRKTVTGFNAAPNRKPALIKPFPIWLNRSAARISLPGQKK